MKHFLEALHSILHPHTLSECIRLAGLTVAAAFYFVLIAVLIFCIIERIMENRKAKAENSKYFRVGVR